MKRLADSLSLDNVKDFIIEMGFQMSEYTRIEDRKDGPNQTKLNVLLFITNNIRDDKEGTKHEKVISGLESIDQRALAEAYQTACSQNTDFEYNQ